MSEEQLRQSSALTMALLSEGLSPEQVLARLTQEGDDPTAIQHAFAEQIPIYLAGEVRRLLSEGVPPLKVQDTLIERGFDKSDVFRAADEVLAPGRPQVQGNYPHWVPPVSDERRDPDAVGALQIVGGLIFALGIVLFAGNVAGFAPTFPGLGYITMLIGGAIFGAGRKQG